MNIGSYVLITACRNESEYIEDLIRCVAAQTVRPMKWVIVDDSSSDHTYELAQKAGNGHAFIEVRRAVSNRPRSFSSQVFAQQEAYECLKDLSFNFVAFLDADIRLPRDYYEKILDRFLDDSSLAVAGGLVVDQSGHGASRLRSRSVSHHVPGGIQCFQRRYYEEIGGYAPIEGGGQDTVAEIECMMQGGQVRSFLDITVHHLRPSEGSVANHFAAGIRWGRMCYNLGYHPLYYWLNSLVRLANQPSARLVAGQVYAFTSATLQGKSRPVSPEFIRYFRRLQLSKLRGVFFPGQRF